VAKQGIRLQYSGFAIFAAKLLSVGTGFFFQFILARALLASPETSPQYGIWFNINDVIAYFTLVMGIVPFWVMRYVARGKEGSVKTGLATTMVIAVIGSVIYLGIIPFILPFFEITGDYLPIYLIASVQIMEYYGISIFESCLQATRPQAVGYGLLFQQVGKVILGYVLIVQLGQPLIGAVISTIVAFGTQLIYYYSLLAEYLKQRVQWGFVKEWLKGSVLNIYSVVGYQIAASIFFLLLIYGTKDGRGIYGAALQIANIISYASVLAFALYPKLLAEQKREDITISLKMVLMFAVPMTFGAIALADSYISLLSPTIADASVVLIILAIDTLIVVVSTIFGSVLYGFETVDQEIMSFKKLVKSKLFLAFSLPYVQAAITLPASYYVLTTYALNQPLQAAFSVGVIIAIGHLITFSMLYAIVRKMIKIDIPWRSIAKYVFASAVMGTVMFLLPHPSTISMTLVMTAIGSAIYLGILLAIDKEARRLPKAVIHEIRRKPQPTA
jgi:O-antigen/teichoic acid export membrane protein